MARKQNRKPRSAPEIRCAKWSRDKKRCLKKLPALTQAEWRELAVAVGVRSDDPQELNGAPMALAGKKKGRASAPKKKVAAKRVVKRKRKSVGAVAGAAPKIAGVKRRGRCLRWAKGRTRCLKRKVG